jgi:hypothetical protein
MKNSDKTDACGIYKILYTFKRPQLYVEDLVIEDLSADMLLTTCPIF